MSVSGWCVEAYEEDGTTGNFIAGRGSQGKSEGAEEGKESRETVNQSDKDVAVRYTSQSARSILQHPAIPRCLPLSG